MMFKKFGEYFHCFIHKSKIWSKRLSTRVLHVLYALHLLASDLKRSWRIL